MAKWAKLSSFMKEMHIIGSSLQKYPIFLFVIFLQKYFLFVKGSENLKHDILLIFVKPIILLTYHIGDMFLQFLFPKCSLFCVSSFPTTKSRSRKQGHAK